MSHEPHEVVIDIHTGLRYSYWIAIEPDGSLIYHHEDDGHCFSTGPAKVYERPITLDEVTKAAGWHSRPTDPSPEEILARVEAALADPTNRGGPIDASQ